MVCNEVIMRLMRLNNLHIIIFIKLYIYSMYNILQGLHDSGALDTSGSITKGMIE